MISRHFLSATALLCATLIVVIVLANSGYAADVEKLQRRQGSATMMGAAAVDAPSTSDTLNDNDARRPESTGHESNPEFLTPQHIFHSFVRFIAPPPLSPLFQAGGALEGFNEDLTQ